MNHKENWVFYKITAFFVLFLLSQAASAQECRAYFETASVAQVKLLQEKHWAFRDFYQYAIYKKDALYGQIDLTVVPLSKRSSSLEFMVRKYFAEEVFFEVDVLQAAFRSILKRHSHVGQIRLRFDLPILKSFLHYRNFLLNYLVSHPLLLSRFLVTEDATLIRRLREYRRKRDPAIRANPLAKALYQRLNLRQLHLLHKEAFRASLMHEPLREVSSKAVSDISFYVKGEMMDLHIQLDKPSNQNSQMSVFDPRMEVSM